MPAERDSAQLFAVLYQSCPRRDYIRHTALRALWVAVFLYSTIAAIIGSKSTISYSVIIILIVTAVLDCAGLVLSCVSLGFRVHHEKCRVRDDKLRAGAGGDVCAQIALLKSAQRSQDEHAESSAALLPRLLVFEYANRRYWCVQSRRPDGYIPSTDDCLEAAARETDRRKHDMAIGKACFAMSIPCAMLNLAVSIVVPILIPTGNSVIFLSRTTLIGLFIASAAGTVAACIFIPVYSVTGISLALLPKPVPTGVMSVNLSGDDQAQVGTINLVQYQEALPGPSLDELEAQNAAAAHRPREGSVDDVSLAGADNDKKCAKADEPTSELWVWGGFANSSSVPEAATVTAAADANSVEVKPLPGPTRPVPAVTAPPADESDSDTFSPSEASQSDASRLPGHL